MRESPVKTLAREEMLPIFQPEKARDPDFMVASLIVESAMLRKESRGLHFTLDYPETDEVARDTVLVP